MLLTKKEQDLFRFHEGIYKTSKITVFDPACGSFRFHEGIYKTSNLLKTAGVAFSKFRFHEGIYKTQQVNAQNMGGNKFRFHEGIYKTQKKRKKVQSRQLHI